VSLARVAAAVAHTTGLDLVALGESTVRGTLRAHVGRLDDEALAAYAARLEAEPTLRVELLRDLLVHETSFFRYPGSFAFVAAEVRRRVTSGAGLVRLLAAPCSSGQESASLVMALLDAGVPGSAFRVHAIDVSADIVARARRGRYSPAEARSLPDAARARFTRATDGGVSLTSEVLAPIEYEVADLLATHTLAGRGRYDLVLCRNLLIYLTPPARARLVRALIALLAPSGVLLVGHAEVAPLRPFGLLPTGPADAYALAPATSGAATTPTRPAPARPVTGQAASAPRPKPRRTPARVRANAESTPASAAPQAPTSPEPLLVTARRLGQEGRAQEALALLAEVEASRTPTPDELHLRAVLARALGQTEEARTALTRALYLDARHVAALRLAALVAEEDGDGETARRLEGRARRAETDRTAATGAATEPA
jgi:chemotaxis protein methyltransferase WspC